MSNLTDVAPGPDVTENPESLSPPPPSRPPRLWNWKKWRARLVVVLMIAATVAGGRWLADSRGGAIEQFDLGTVTLTAQAIPVESSQSGQVSAVRVAPQQHVTRGQQVGTMVVSTTTATGTVKQTSVALTAPAAGIVSGDPTPVGGIVQPGQPFVQLYDPAKLTLNAAVRVQDLPKLSVGMHATLRADGLQQPVEAVMQRVVPVVSDQTDNTGKLATTQSRLQLVLAPADPADVAGLIPGLRFTGTIDTSSGVVTSVDGLHVNRG
jgi:multidrug resistance efflux pump